MRHPLTFVKCSGAGNDFVLIDRMEGTSNLSMGDLAQALCSRPFGVGADGLLLIEPSSRGAFLMRYYNADGSYGGMCGNGGRCAAMYAHRAGYAQVSMTFEALDYLYQAEVVDGEVRLFMKDPRQFHLHKELQDLVPGTLRPPVFLDTGAPHIVFQVSDVRTLDVERFGKAMRNHPAFSPAGTNVDFMQVDNQSSIILRTYERGVERETLACGTGSVASAIVSTLEGEGRPPVSVHVQSGETVVVDFNGRGEEITAVSLKGSAHILFKGNALYDDSSHQIHIASLT
ncbi:MAG: diaminopimelate epimerase [Bacteroidota bacterium]